jgi:hypothetical protein
MQPEHVVHVHRLQDGTSGAERYTCTTGHTCMSPFIYFVGMLYLAPGAALDDGDSWPAKMYLNIMLGRLNCACVTFPYTLHNGPVLLAQR